MIINEENPRFGRMQQVKRHMFAMRNGVISDTMRKAGSTFKVIFGLNLPQIIEMAQVFGPDPELARELWANTATRESMLLAPMLIPAADFGEAEARQWIETVPCIEVADILCHRLLRHTPYAQTLATDLCLHATGLRQYTGLRLMANISREYPQAAAEATTACADSDDRAVRALAAQLAQGQ